MSGNSFAPKNIAIVAYSDVDHEAGRVRSHGTGRPDLAHAHRLDRGKPVKSEGRERIFAATNMAVAFELFDSYFCLL
jgi:hypothetical protein